MAFLIYIKYKIKESFLRVMFLCLVPLIFIILFNIYAKLVSNEIIIQILGLKSS
jgi:hypothetical protein